MAEVIRGGLQAIPKGQFEAADAMGLGYWQKMRLVILPQALRLVIPGIVNSFISLFKDTSLVFIMGLYDLLNISRLIVTGQDWLGHDVESYIFAALRLLDLLLRHVPLSASGSSASCRPATSTEGPMADQPGRQRRPEHRAARRQQVVRRVPRARERQPAGREGPEGRGLRAVRLGQVDHDPLHQPARGASEGPHRRRRDRAHQRRQERRRDPPRGRDGVPALQPVPASDHPRQPDPGADLGARHAQEGGRGDGDVLPQPGAHPRAGAQVSRASSRAASSSGSRSPAPCA